MCLNGFPNPFGHDRHINFRLGVICVNHPRVYDHPLTHNIQIEPPRLSPEKVTSSLQSNLKHPCVIHSDPFDLYWAVSFSHLSKEGSAALEFSTHLILVLTVESSAAKRNEMAATSETQADTNHFLLRFPVKMRCGRSEGAWNNDTGAYQGLNSVRDGWYKSLDAPPQGCCWVKIRSSKTQAKEVWGKSRQDFWKTLSLVARYSSKALEKIWKQYFLIPFTTVCVKKKCFTVILMNLLGKKYDVLDLVGQKSIKHVFSYGYTSTASIC